MSVTTKIIGLAASAVVFTGMAFGQANLSCNPGTTAPGLNAVANPPTTITISPAIPIELRSEGATELVSDELVACNAAQAGSTTGQVTATLSATGIQGVTSKLLAGGVTEATLIITDSTTPAVHAYYQGTVVGTTVTFGTAAVPVTFPTNPFAAQIANIRVNVTGQWPNNLQPVTEAVQFVAQGNGLAAVTNIAPQIVGNMRNSLVVTGNAATTLTSPGSNSAGAAAGILQYLVCTTGAPSGSGVNAFSFTIGEQFAGAFKTKIQPGAVTVAGIPGAETGSLTGQGLAGTGVANFGTRFKLAFTNIPANATVNVPLVVTNGGFTMVLQSSAETATSVAAVSTAVGASGIAIYEVTVADYTATGSFPVTPWVTYTTNAVVATNTPITVAVSYAPSSALSVANGGALPSPLPTVPYFANTSTPMTGSTFAACQTTLLFPYVVASASLGYDTGIVIANAGKDNLGAANASVATGQSGACTFQFYGSSTGVEGGAGPAAALAPNFPAAGAIAPGATHADLLSNIAANFDGYAIATCPFLYAKGFAYIANNTATTHTAMGYAADLIGSDRKASVPGGFTVGNNSPESSGQ